MHTGRTNRVVEQAIRSDRVPELLGYPSVRREVRVGQSRVDLVLQRGVGRLPWESGEGPVRPACVVEVKNATLWAGAGRVVFPDAVTSRGVKHLRELSGLAQRGTRSMLFFHVGHTAAEEVGVARSVDPVYADAFEQAVEAGVEVLAWRVALSTRGVRLDRPVPLVV